MVVIIALIVFGPKRLPELGRQLGRGLREAKKQMSEIGDEMTRSADEATPDDLRPQVAATSATATASAGAATVSTTASTADDDLMDGVVVAGASDVADAPVAAAPSDDDLLDGIVVSGDTRPGVSPRD